MNTPSKESKEQTTRGMNIILVGGGNIEPIFCDLGEQNVFKGKKTGYVIVATETMPELNASVRMTERKLCQIAMGYGAQKFIYIDNSNLDALFTQNVVIIAGGDTNYLIARLKIHEFSERIRNSPSIETIVGISAGAIALADSGISRIGGDRELVRGFGLIPVIVVPHSTEKIRGEYPDFLHLQENQMMHFKCKY